MGKINLIAEQFNCVFKIQEHHFYFKAGNKY